MIVLYLGALAGVVMLIYCSARIRKLDIANDFIPFEIWLLSALALACAGVCLIGIGIIHGGGY